MLSFYVSNFGTKELSFRIPTRLLKTHNLCPYKYEYIVEIEPYKDISIITLHLNDEKGGGWVDEEDCSNLFHKLLHLRQDLLLGDPRALYLALIRPLHGAPGQVAMQWSYDKMLPY
jgi:hypothetical protein